MSDDEAAGLPGEDLIVAGLDDLTHGTDTIAALLVSIGAPRLQSLGIAIPREIEDPERRLFDLLARAEGDAAHGRYNALVRRLVSFERAARLGHQRAADARRIQRLIKAFGRAAPRPTRIYLVGGTTAVLMGWRTTTIDVDVVIRPETDTLLRSIPELKETLQVNIELASPLDFIPIPAGWEDRGTYIETRGDATFYHFDLYAQALAKVERGHRQDIADVAEMLTRGVVEPGLARAYFGRIEPELFRFPAIDVATFRRAVTRAFGQADAT